MAASTEVLIGDSDGQHLLIRALTRSHPGLFDHPDADWIVCDVEIAAGGFRGQFRADLRSEEFQAFLEEVEGLSTMLEGTAAFSAMEGQMEVSLAGSANGQIGVEGEEVDDAGTGNRLHFAFEIDQTQLPDITRAVASLLAAFPVTGPSSEASASSTSPND